MENQKILTEGEKKTREKNLQMAYDMGFLTESEVLNLLADLQ